MVVLVYLMENTRTGRYYIAEYSVNNLFITFFSHFTFIYGFASTEIRVETEVWGYPTISFIADLGGSLGLFVGVSFLSAWDFLEYLFLRFRLRPLV